MSKLRHRGGNWPKMPPQGSRRWCLNPNHHDPNPCTHPLHEVEGRKSSIYIPSIWLERRPADLMAPVIVIIEIRDGEGEIRLLEETGCCDFPAVIMRLLSILGTSFHFSPSPELYSGPSAFTCHFKSPWETGIYSAFLQGVTNYHREQGTSITQRDNMLFCL